jgi:hypothetical protein
MFLFCLIISLDARILDQFLPVIVHPRVKHWWGKSVHYFSQTNRPFVSLLYNLYQSRLAPLLLLAHQNIELPRPERQPRTSSIDNIGRICNVMQEETGATGENLRCQRESPFLSHEDGSELESNPGPPSQRWQALMLNFEHRSYECATLTAQTHSTLASPFWIFGSAVFWKKI